MKNNQHRKRPQRRGDTPVQTHDRASEKSETVAHAVLSAALALHDMKWLANQHSTILTDNKATSRRPAHSPLTITAPTRPATTTATPLQGPIHLNHPKNKA